MPRFAFALSSVCLLAGCLGGLDQDTSAKIKELEGQLPLGSTLADAERIIKASGSRHTAYSASNCERNVQHTKPSYTPKGGPCLFALARIGQTWYGYRADLQVRLLFDGSGKLAARTFHRIDTFL